MGTPNRMSARATGPARLLLRGLMLDHPHWCSLLLILVVAMHWLLASRHPNTDLLRALDQSAIKGQVAELYISVTGVSALASGFAGVVIVFGLQSESSRFRRFRWAGGGRLIGNWMAVIGTHAHRCQLPQPRCNGWRRRELPHVSALAL
jgi:hypothetical protein